MGEVYHWIFRTFCLGMFYCLTQMGIMTFFKGRNKVATAEISKDLRHLKGTDGFKLAKGYQLNFFSSCQGVAVIAPPAEGKSSSCAYPQLLSDHFPKNTSIVINDNKGELYRDTARYQKSIGRKIVLLEPLGPNGHINLLEFCNNYSKVRALANNILINGTLSTRLSTGSGGLSGSDATWITMTTPLLTASLLHHKDLPAPNNTISAAIKYIIKSDEDELEITLGNSTNELVKEQYKSFTKGAKAEGMIGSILGTFTSNVQLFLDPKIIETTSYSDFTPQMLRTEKVALYIHYEAEQATYLAPFISIFYTILIEETKPLQFKNYNGIVWILDEFQNLGKIANFSQTVNTCKEARFAFMICVQSISKVYDIYGRNDTEAILGGLKTKCILPSISEIEMMNKVSTWCGPTEVPITENGRTHKVKKQLFELAEVRMIDTKKIVIVAHNLNAIIADQLSWYENDEMFMNKYVGGL